MIQIWHCPRCSAAARTVDDKLPHHACPGMAGLMVPLVRENHRANFVAVEREDYAGTDKVLLDANGRPIMAVEVQHPDGSTDRTVYAPTATISAEEVTG